jgi:hypothetical protein
LIVSETVSVSEVLAFLGIAVLVIVTPGPDTAMTIRGTLLGGRRRSSRSSSPAPRIWSTSAARRCAPRS